MSWAKGRVTPYACATIGRQRCVRCGESAAYQWQVCADNNRYRPLCRDCDIALNTMVLEWARDPDWRAKIAAYKARA